MEGKREVQIVKCSGCDQVFAACCLPEAHEDAQWHRDIRKYSKKGHKIETVNALDFAFGRCTCDKEAKNGR